MNSQEIEVVLPRYTETPPQIVGELYPFSFPSVATRGADKSFARRGRKQTRNHVRDTRDFNNIETRAVINFFPARQGAEGIHIILTETLVCFLLVGLRAYQHPCSCSKFTLSINSKAPILAVVLEVTLQVFVVGKHRLLCL